MAQQTTVKRSAAAAAANADTIIFTPAAGVKVKVLSFYVVSEGAIGGATPTFELRYGANIIALVGLESATAPIGFQSKQAIMAHEIIGDGVTTVVGRNLGTLQASQTAGYVVTFDANY